MEFESVLREINNISIDNLPDINITEEQKAKARKRLFKSIDKLKERNHMLKINVSDEEVLKISNELGVESEEYLKGVKHGAVLREVTLKAINDDVKKNYGEIVSEVFTTNAMDMSNVIWLAEGTVYFKIFITKEKIITYSFTKFFKVIDRSESDIKAVLGAGLCEYKKYYIEYGEKIIYLTYTSEDTKNEIEKIIDILKNNGVENHNERKIKKIKIINIIAIIFVIVISIIAIIEIT